MNNVINTSNFKTDNYLYLSDNLNSILLDYWNFFLKSVTIKNSKNKEYIYEIISILQLGAEIKNINFNKNPKIIGGYYNYDQKSITLDIEKLISMIKSKILSEENGLIEYYTMLFHEIFHAIQYKYLANNNDYLISTMKFFFEYNKNKA